MATHLEYDHITNSYNYLPKLLAERCFSTACFLFHGYYVLIGGIEITKLDEEEEKGQVNFDMK